MKNSKIKSIFVAILYTLGFIITQILTCVVGISIISLRISNSDKVSYLVNKNIVLFSMIGYLIYLAILFLINKVKSIKNPINLNCKQPVQLLLPLLCIFFFASFWNILFSFIPISESNEMLNIEQSLKSNPFIYILAIYIMAPIIEEIIFRGIIMNQLRNQFSVLSTVIISSILFGAVHLMTGSLITIVYAFLGGIVMGLSYELSNSLMITILVHIIGNLCGLIPVLIVGQPIELQYFLIVLLFISFILTFLSLINKTLKHNN